MNMIYVSIYLTVSDVLKESVKVKGYLIELQLVFSLIIFQIINAYMLRFL